MIEGATSPGGRTSGTYLHRLFDHDAFRHAFLESRVAASHIAPPCVYANVKAEHETRFDRLAALVMDGFWNAAQTSYTSQIVNRQLAVLTKAG